MAVFEVEVEMMLESPTPHQMGVFGRALDIASGVLAESDWGLLVASFSVAAVSYRQAVWRALEKVGNGARALGISEEPVSLTVMGTDDYFRRLSERINGEPACPVLHDECPFNEPSAS
ncbi:hypothetical protein [Amycolatopsis circi]|uniref:hypothetical protein n=1 Tax=Amycolatopsis circi TaxID=871959 RepID=UPI0013BE9DD4|nr:hypothetical protein [Amycolatopsis circi]